MKINKISIENIRSYEKEKIEFPTGSTLLSGDIGTGKTSILLAIEFALFGLQPGQKGSSLLRNGANFGAVSIEFEVDGKEIVIERTLKRGKKSISQDYCSIMINQERLELSVTELKNKVLELLNYPMEFSKKQNILYKFTVYTPQESMKEIILQDPETRINTLRHVFGIDKYKTIIENTSILLSKLREEKKLKQGMTANLEQDKAELALKKEELESKGYNLVSIEKELFSKTEVRKKAQEEKEEISRKIEEKNKIQSEIEKTKLMISTKTDSVLSNEKLIETLRKQIEELKNLKFDENKISEIEKSVEMLKQEKQELNEKQLEVSSKISSLNLKNQENDDLKKNISRLEMCPTCLQDVNPVHKSNVESRLDEEITQNIKQIKPLTIEKINLSEKINKIEFDISKFQNEIQELKITKIRVQGINEKTQRVEELERNNIAFKRDIELLNQHIQSLRNSLFELKKFENIFNEKTQEFDSALKQERLAEIKVAELKREIDVFEKQIQELSEKIKKTQEIKKQLNYLSELENWIKNNFVPLISNVEKNVMVKLKTEFSKLFSEWFSMLVYDSFNIYLDDKFTPVIEQQDYEIDYSYLSGGERTAVALAYRLALNQVINSLLSKIKTRDIVILDEPTDGFSEQQLDKMRTIFEQLNVAQLIIVSHEQKIEGFVENVIKFNKENGVSHKG